MTGRQFLIILIITFITVLLWVIFDILHARSEVVIDQETEVLMEPIKPELDISGFR
jgi:hypothetical protein